MRACTFVNPPSPFLPTRKNQRSSSSPSLTLSNSRVSLSLISPNRINRCYKPQAKSRHEDEDEEGARHVHCEVDVVSWRERRIRARILVDADVDEVWRVLTDYERLADFIPNLVYSGRIPCPHQGRIWLEQRGLQRALYWHIEARVVLDLQEFPDLADGRELQFSMVDGDFKKFEGRWSVKAGPRSSTSYLAYDVSVIPRFNFPAIFIERIITSDLPVNLRALACRAERSLRESEKIPVAGNGAGAILSNVASTSDIQSSNNSNEKFAGLGVSTVPVSSNIEYNSNWGVFGKVCSLDRPCMVDEVHLRRFDGLLENGGTHRCVIASITVKAPVQAVWSVLTSYEELPEIVPNLAISKILLRDNNKVRILQVIYEDLPSNLCAIRDFVEKREASMTDSLIIPDEPIPFTDNNAHISVIRPVEEVSSSPPSTTSKHRPKVPGLQRDFEVLKAELQAYISEYGQEGFMPMRKQLRLHGRVDIEKAITRMGGFRKVANSMNLSLAYKHRKPRGYWDNLENLQEEISRFQRSWGMDPAYMPSRKSFERAGRYDIARALEKWGGLQEVSRLLSLELRHPRRKSAPEREKQRDVQVSDEHNSQEKMSNKPYVSQDTQKWLMKLKDLDINWVE
ncbi:uncharacterized protein LOC109836542 isoform X3 [Asparagus officinalis]|uniref:uncharacterized protein LOC109836542 isoform X3 n=1 Tax=Asparagus officinalis TaxID=4686 RepID=UPI00098DE703|nr:uncharacterized protein LOC109836542 isoform X3 [Asparagus officinalis]